ncbi:MAG: gliding motility-associated C-terminal domain-containing protein [Saprospiraceae bacterium]
MKKLILLFFLINFVCLRIATGGVSYIPSNEVSTSILLRVDTFPNIVVALSQACDNNGTSTYAGDDKLELYITVYVDSLRDTFIIKYDGVQIGGDYHYFENIWLPLLPIDGNSHTLTIQDKITGDIFNILLAPVSPCSSDSSVIIYINPDPICEGDSIVFREKIFKEEGDDNFIRIKSTNALDPDTTYIINLKVKEVNRPILNYIFNPGCNSLSLYTQDTQDYFNINYSYFSKETLQFEPISFPNGVLIGGEFRVDVQMKTNGCHSSSNIIIPDSITKGIKVSLETFCVGEDLWVKCNTNIVGGVLNWSGPIGQTFQQGTWDQKVSVDGLFSVNFAAGIGCEPIEAKIIIERQNEYPLFSIQSKEENCTPFKIVLGPEFQIANANYTWSGPNGFISNSAIINIIAPGSYSGIAYFSNGCTTSDTIFISGPIIQDSLKIKEFETLMALYDSTNGDGWKNNTGWKEGKAGTNCDPCNGWYGVSCTESGRVKKIKLNNNNLIGNINNFKNLDMLCGVSINSNKLVGHVPELYHNIFLDSFSCSLNQFDGKIPELSKNINLISFDCSHNLLTGNIPVLDNNIKLTYFACNSNRLSGIIPTLLNNTSLVHFQCSYNELIGSIPSLSNNKELTIFYCNDNELSGPIPELSGNNLLNMFDCSNNLLTENLPELFNNKSLTDYYCSNNRLTGQIPSLSNNELLKHFNCGDNEITGQIPNLDHNINLINFICSGNLLTGAIPSLKNTIKLEGFFCQNNQLSGEIPDLSQLERLIFFICNENRLSGKLPELTKLKDLNVFVCNNNLLSGAIPKLNNNVNLANFNCNSNLLSGAIPDLEGNPNLLIFLCAGNRLSGNIPSISSNLKLAYFNCAGNDLSGLLPSLSPNQELKYFNCSGNKLHGHIPDLFNNVELTNFYCAHNYLDGFIPSLSKNSNLRYFDCSSNQLRGCYNTSICRDSLTFSSLNNPNLSWQGDHVKFCNGESQTGSNCNDMDSTTINDAINENCECKGEPINLCGSHPDYSTLMALYDSTNGNGWINNAGWKEGKAGTNCDPCNGWYGVECENGRVVTLSLPANNLKGHLVDISAIVDLKTLTIFGNNLVGKIPDFSFNLKLEEFYCGNNFLEGEIPDISRNPNLKYFFCDNNQLTGEIPSFSIDDKMVIFRCSFNKLVGQIPNLSNNVNLEAFICSNNLMTGIIPDLSRNIKLLNFDCSRNMLTGEIPDLSKNINLNGFNCGGNMLSGKIQDLSNNLNLRIFLCNNNQLTGPIPKFNYSVPNFLYFCEYNDLSGCYPFELCNSTTSGSFSFIGNPKLPWEGDHKRFCNGGVQNGAYCNDQNELTINDKIQLSCECRGSQTSPCDSIALSPDFYVLNEKEKTQINIFDNDDLGSNGLDSSIRISVNVLQSQNASIILNVAKTIVTVEIGQRWADTINLEYILEDSLCDQTVKSFIYLVNKSWFEESICSELELNRDVFTFSKNEEITLNILENDFVGDLPLPESISTGLSYQVKSLVLPKDIKTEVRQSGDDFYLTIQEDWIDTLFAKYEVCITAPCDTCMTIDIAFVNKALEDITLTTIFSPDGDGINDQLKFTTSSEIKDSELWIFNRYGTQVYHKKDYTNDWDASGFGGGIYYYVLNYKGVQIKKLLTIVK